MESSIKWKKNNSRKKYEDFRKPEVHVRGESEEFRTFHGGATFNREFARSVRQLVGDLRGPMQERLRDEEGRSGLWKVQSRAMAAPSRW